ncbi:MAG: lipopolysaccharide biosynthesis protein [Actinomycetia bacterium]|nr:lipopolysaccharide biosynthesis protein [Actinomycetes bacterium]
MTMKERIASIGPEGLARRAGWAGAVEVMQLISSLLVFFVLASLMTKDDYGRMTAVLGMAMVASGLAGFGSHVLLIKRVSQGEPLSQAWPRATSVGIIGPAVGALVLIGLQPFLLSNVDRLPYILLVLAQVNFFWLSELAVFVGNGTRRLKEAAQIRFMILCCRLLALGWFALWGGGELVRWAAASMISFAVSAVLAVGYIWLVFGVRPSLLQGRLVDVREGTPYSINAVSESLVDVSDRPLLAHYGHLADAGVYGLGGRIAQLGYLPLRIIMRASDADLFQAGKRGTAPAFAVARSLLGPSVALSVGVGVAMVVLAPVVPLMIGDKWIAAVDAIRLLAALPLVRGVQWLLGNTLSASAHQMWRVGATWSAAALNLSLNLILLPTGTWRTAVFTTMVSEVYLTAALGAFILYWVRRESTDARGQ